MYSLGASNNSHVKFLKQNITIPSVPATAMIRKSIHRSTSKCPQNGSILLHEDTDVLLSDYAVLKVAEEEYEKLDQQYLIKIRKEAYGYRCLTNQKQFYMENYPDVVIENGKIDDLVVMMEEQV